MANWWNQHYKYRKQVFFDLSIGDLSGHIGRIYLDDNMMINGKIRPDYYDIRLVYNNVTVVDPSNFLIQHQGDRIALYFLYPDSLLIDYDIDIDDRFYVYYGDTFCESPESLYPLEPLPLIDDMPVDYEYGDLVIPDFPEFIELNDFDSRIGFTKPTEDWVNITAYDGEDLIDRYVLSPQSAAGAKVSFDFYGDTIGVFSNVGPGYGVLRVELDDQDFEIDLYETEEEKDVLIFKAHNLDEKQHALAIINTGARSPNAISLDTYYKEDTSLAIELESIPSSVYAPVNVKKIGFSAYAVGILSNEETVSSFTWNSKIGGIL